MMDLSHLQRLLDAGETLACEFKSDRQRLSDAVLYEEVVALANSEGGVLLVGVEDDGTVTGAKPRHGKATEPRKLQAAIFNNTVPSINTRIAVLDHPDGPVLAIEVDSYPEPCATASGKSLHRTMGPSDGRPQTAPFYPRDQRSRRTDLGLLDFSAQPLEALTFDDLDPLEFERLRQMVRRLRGDASLEGLSNQEVAKALKLVETKGRKLVPNVAGALLLGRVQVLEEILPTGKAHFQVLDVLGEVRVNDTFAQPLLRVIEELEARFAVRNQEREVDAGLFRIPVPDYSPISFREAVNNALLHRDYSKLDAVYVQWHPEHLLITSPGGFPDGVTVQNILVHEPKPRNPRLAEAFKRIGLVEQTGRGVDRIYQGQLRYGRPVPNYERSDRTAVRVILMGGTGALDFTSFVYQQERSGKPIPLDQLLVLNQLYHERRTSSSETAEWIQKSVPEARHLLEKLTESGLLEAQGVGRSRTYHLSASLYREMGGVSRYVRTKGFDRVQHKRMVVEAIQASKDKRITREAVADLCQVAPDQAYRLLKAMVTEGLIEMIGKKKGAFYILPKSTGNTRKSVP